jgi:hypothetical protein
MNGSMREQILALKSGNGLFLTGHKTWFCGLMREIVSNPVSEAFDSQLLQPPMHSASTPGAFEDLQPSGFWAGDGQSEPYTPFADPHDPEGAEVRS